MKRINSALCVLILVLVPALLSIPLKSYFHSPAESAEDDLIYRMFGGLRGLLADWAFMKGEEYFHGGLPVAATDFSECLQKELDESRKEQPGEEHSDEHKNEQGNKMDLYSKIYSFIKVTHHSHLAFSEEKEMLPWFYLQVRFNPRDIQGYILGGYWLRRLGKYDEAFRFLKEGEKHNPGSAQIQMAMGELYFRNKNYGKAIEYFERARLLWLDGKPPNLASDNYSKSDRAYTFDVLGNLCERTGRSSLAAQVYRELYSFEPSRKALLEKIKKLRSKTLNKPTTQTCNPISL